MAYEPHEWQNNDLITAENLNHLEQGVKEASAFEQAVNNGYKGTEAEFYAALVSLQSAMPYLAIRGGVIWRE